jgi:ABC-2 type transport system permease protein
VVVVLSGSLLPLPLYPDAIAAVLFVQPLAGVLDIPNRIYSGALTGPAAWAGLGLQAFWTFALILAGRLWLGQVMRRLEVQGG